MKTCTKCGAQRPIEEFAKGHGYADGHSNWCPSCHTECNRQWKAENREECEAKRIAYEKKYVERRRKIRREWQARHRPFRSPSERICDNIRAKVWAQLKGVKGRRSTFKLLGYTPEELKSHMESLFKPGMSWDNYGEWHIDHRRPRASFVIESAEDKQFLQCWSLSNLQPLWAIENSRKSDFWTEN